MGGGDNRERSCYQQRMQDLAHRPATYEDLRAVPPHLVAEIIGGRLVTHPRPAPRQSNSGSVLGGILNSRFQTGENGPGGWWIVDEPELHLHQDIVVPDIAGWRRERMPRLPDDPWLELAPDWACEVLSPSTQRRDKGEKRDIYAASGIRHLWHVDTPGRLIEVFELTGGKWLLQRTFRDDEEVAAPPFEAAPFRLGLLWAD